MMLERLLDLAGPETTVILCPITALNRARNARAARRASRPARQSGIGSTASLSWLVRALNGTSASMARA